MKRVGSDGNQPQPHAKPTPRPEVFVFEANAKSVLPVAESFWRQDFRLAAGSSLRHCMGCYSRWVRARVLYPDEVHRPDEYADFPLDLVRLRRFEMIVPLGDALTQLVCRRRNEVIRERGLGRSAGSRALHTDNCGKLGRGQHAMPIPSQTDCSGNVPV